MIEIYTDGACSGNPGVGGYCAILQCRNKNGSIYERVVSGNDSNTTNNRMELTAVIKGLQALKRKCEDVYIVSDSKYVCDAFNNHWIESWHKNNWRKPNGSELKNSDLWRTLYELINIHEVHFHWIKGHNGHPENERCDMIATSEYLGLKLD